MSTLHPIIIIEDDADDCEAIQLALEEIGILNEQKCFQNGLEALNYLQSTSEQTFLILSDVNMPILNGFQLKEEINKNDKLRIQSIPFIFLTTSGRPKDVDVAYNLLVQGFFQKPDTFGEIKDLLKMVTHYWRTAKQPTGRVN